MNMKNIKPYFLLFTLGFLGILSIIPLIPQLLAIKPVPLTMSVQTIQIISVVQSSILLLLVVWLGSVFSKKVGLSAPVIFALSRSEDAYKQLKPQIVPALIGGILGGLFILIFLGYLVNYLPPEFISAGEKLTPAWYSKILYGGITEEILIRWGLMSFFVWVFYRLSQKNGSEIKSYNYILGIILSAIIFGLGHLPVAFALSTVVTIPLLVYIILGNAAFGLIAGYLYWKRGLECAIGAHMIAHITMIIGAGFS